MEPLKSLEGLGRLAVGEQDALADRVVDLEVAQRRFVETRVAAPRPRARVLALAAALVAVLTGVAVFALRFEHTKTALTFRVGEGGPLGEPDAWIAPPATALLPLGFSDGTSVTLEPSARARVTKVSAAGATILLESGRARLSVVKRKGAAWQVSLGPFRVDVTGTRFEVGWDPRTERLSLDMHEGSVLVSGCVFGTGRPFTAGESMTASCHDQHVEISKTPSVPTPEVVPPTEGSPGGGTEVLPAPSLSPSATNTEDTPGSTANRHGADLVPPRGAAAPPGWRDLVRAGRHGEALDAAEALGFSSECGAASASDLMSLGDAARYVGRLDRAVEAYETTRRRFPGDERSAVAAFTLGRISFDQRGNYAGAVRWFRTYLTEQPGGRLARDALGRLVESLQRAGDTASARREATHYLERYPTGPHAEFARRLVGE